MATSEPKKRNRTPNPNTPLKRSKKVKDKVQTGPTSLPLAQPTTTTTSTTTTTTTTNNSNFDIANRFQITEDVDTTFEKNNELIQLMQQTLITGGSLTNTIDTMLLFEKNIATLIQISSMMAGEKILPPLPVKLNTFFFPTNTKNGPETSSTGLSAASELQQRLVAKDFKPPPSIFSHMIPQNVIPNLNPNPLPNNITNPVPSPLTNPVTIPMSNPLTNPVANRTTQNVHVPVLMAPGQMLHPQPAIPYQVDLTVPNNAFLQGFSEESISEMMKAIATQP